MNQASEILVIGSYPPRQCGIATYTQDLVHEIKKKFGTSFSIKVCALENRKEELEYPAEVKYIFSNPDPSGYLKLAETINADKNIKLVFIQHEFGLFGGSYGEDVLHLLYSLNKPILTTFHTILPNPEDKRKKTVQAISMASERIIVMTNHSSEILKNDYQISAEKISVIHHGTHLIGYKNKNTAKKQHSLEGKLVLSTFGLLSSGKGIETAIDALPRITKKFPNVIYQILGRTHPEVVKHEGEKYREFLEDKIKKLNLEKNIRFVNKYLSLEDVLEYLQLTDIYLFTSKDPNQAVSGTFSYAMGCACPIISTPIPHAKEMLNDNAGIIIDFENSDQLADAAIKLLSNPKLRKEMSLQALHKIYPTSWQNSAIAHAELFKKIAGRKISIKYSIPEISLDHIKRLTTRTGIVQFAEICRPELNSGYTLDDNARALIAVIEHYEITRNREDITLIGTYLNFIKFAQQPDGKFLNYVDKHGNYHEKNNYVNLEDSMGRAIWALGEFISRGDLLPDSYSKKAERIIKKALPVIRKFKSPRAIAFSIKGLYHYNNRVKNQKIKSIIKELADNLTSKYHQVSDNSWKWFEEYLTYANSIIPESLLYAYLETKNELYKDVAKTSFNFLLSLTFHDKKIKVISNRGWHNKGEQRKHFGEQPIDVAYTISTLDLFYEFFREEDYRNKIEIAFSWFQGNNHLHQIIYNPVTGGCQDGLEEHNVNMNQGAESTVCYLIARIVMEKYAEVEKTKTVTRKMAYESLPSQTITKLKKAV